MKFGSLFAGIGGFDLGFERAGMSCAWQVEIDKHCQRVLELHWPNVKRYQDITQCVAVEMDPVDVLCGGFPCQGLSNANTKREGLHDERSGLFWHVVRLAAEIRPAWLVLENVLGLFSSADGLDMLAVVNALDEVGYGISWRVLDAQYFGVPQQRRRVFIVGRAGRACPPEILCDSEGRERDSAAGKKTWSVVARSINGKPRNGSDLGTDNYVLAPTIQRNGTNSPNRNTRTDAKRFLIPSATDPVGIRTVPRVSGRLDDSVSDTQRYKMLGNAVPPPMTEWIGRKIMEWGE